MNQIRFYCLLATLLFTGVIRAAENNGKLDCMGAKDQSAINNCVGQRALWEVEENQRQFNVFARKWRTEVKAAFQAYEQAREQFIAGHLENELDWPLNTTGRHQAAFEEEARLRSDERAVIVAFETGQWPALSDQDFTTIDGRLNDLYKSIQNRLGGEDLSDPPSGVTAAGIRKTQRVWLHYRDAWAKFAHLQYPQLSLIAWQAFVTQKRIDQLQALVQ
jgi:uncharacterized protein YecT (DUF1311 family)